MVQIIEDHKAKFSLLVLFESGRVFYLDVGV